MKKSIYWIIGGVAVYYILSKTLLAKRLNFLFQDVNFRAKGLNAEINLSFMVQNPANVSATIQAISGNIYINNKVVANVSTFEKQTISPKSESLIKITAKPSVFGAVQIIIDIIKKKFTGAVRFEGSANVDGVLIPIKQSVNV